MIVSFKTREISRRMHKWIQILTLVKKKKKEIYRMAILKKKIQIMILLLN
jgi:hypothetical protein